MVITDHFKWSYVGSIPVRSVMENRYPSREIKFSINKYNLFNSWSWNTVRSKKFSILPIGQSAILAHISDPSPKIISAIPSSRLDFLVFCSQWANSIFDAKNLIINGKISVNSKVCKSANKLIPAGSILEIDHLDTGSRILTHSFWGITGNDLLHISYKRVLVL